MMFKLLRSAKALSSLNRLCPFNLQIACYHKSDERDRRNPDKQQNRHSHGRQRPFIMEEQDDNFSSNHLEHGFKDLEEYVHSEHDYSGHDASAVFERSDEMYDEYLREKNWRRGLRQRKTIQHKYFDGPPEVNLLSWAAKEQIRHLRKTNPQVWTPERLAESFPVSVKGVKKFLKNKLTLRTHEQIRKHDEHVAANWKALKLQGGPIAAPKRSQPVPTSSAVQLRVVSNPTTVAETSEFSDIIADYQNRVSGKVEAPTAASGTAARKKEMLNVLQTNHKPMTAQEFTQRALVKTRGNQMLSDAEKEEIESHLSCGKANVTAEDIRPFKEVAGRDSYLRAEEYAEEEAYWNERSEDPDPAPPKIEVDLRKKTKLHRYKDAFYDEHGMFLYRVPGMK